MSEIKGKIKRIWPNPKNHVVELEDGFRMSAFGKAPDDLEEGNEYSFNYETKGQYNNYKSFVTLTAIDKAVEKATQKRVQQIQVIVHPDRAEFQQMVNAFMREHDVFATNPLIMPDGRFVAVLYYHDGAV